jgi:hypothetical protein
MNKADVIKMFYNQEQVKYQKGFKLFEEVYNDLKERLDLTRTEEGNTVIVRHRKTKVELIKELLEVKNDE